MVDTNIISEAEFVALLSSFHGAKALGLTVRTDARLRQTGNPYGKVWKTSRVNVLINFHYDEGVLRRLEKEGKSPEDFLRGESWHKAVITEEGHLTAFCNHPKTGEFYLRVQLRGRGLTTYATEDGEEVTREEIEPFLPKGSHYANQGLDNPLEFLTYKLVSIVELRVDGETYTIQ